MHATANERIAAICAAAAISQETFKLFGYWFRPIYGAAWQGLLPQRWVKLHMALMQEVFGAFASSFLRAGVLQNVSGFLAEFVQKPGIVNAMGYTSKREAIRDLAESMAGYATSEWTEIASCFLSRIETKADIPKARITPFVIGSLVVGQRLHHLQLVMNISEEALRGDPVAAVESELGLR